MVFIYGIAPFLQFQEKKEDLQVSVYNERSSPPFLSFWYLKKSMITNTAIKLKNCLECHGSGPYQFFVVRCRHLIRSKQFLRAYIKLFGLRYSKKNRSGYTLFLLNNTHSQTASNGSYVNFQLSFQFYLKRVFQFLSDRFTCLCFLAQHTDIQTWSARNLNDTKLNICNTNPKCYLIQYFGLI